MTKLTKVTKTFNGKETVAVQGKIGSNEQPVASSKEDKQQFKAAIAKMAPTQVRKP